MAAAMAVCLFACDTAFGYPEWMKIAFPDLARLSPQERLSLIAQLWDSLTEVDVPLTPAQEAELNHRLASVENDRKDSVTWEELQAELQRRPSCFASSSAGLRGPRSLRLRIGTRRAGRL